MNLTGQIIGIIAIAISFLIYIQNSRFKIVFLKLVTDVLWVAHHFLISAYTASLTTFIAIVREIVFLRKDKNKETSPFVLAVFSFLFCTAAIVTWRDFFSIFPAIASVSSTFAFSSNSIKRIRIFAFVSSVCMFVYGIRYMSVPTVINEILTQTSIITAFVKEYKEYKRKD